MKEFKSQSGILLVEMLLFLLFVGVITAIAWPRVSFLVKKIATKEEMRFLVTTIQFYEIDKGVLPTTLSSLKPDYYSTDDYKKDAWFNNYTYNTTTRKLCSTNVQVGCMDF